MVKKILITFGILTVLVSVISIVIAFSNNVIIFGSSYSTNTKFLDLSSINMMGDNSWITKLDEFKNLKVVNLGDNILTPEQKEDLEEKYPNVDFLAKSIITVYGLEIAETAEEINFSSVVIDGNIVKKLEPFTNLKRVNLGTNKISLELQEKLVKEHPDVEFNWLIKVADEYYNSNIEKIDLTGQTINKGKLIRALKLFNNLEYLDLSDTNLSNEEMAGIREMFPNTKVVWTIYFGVWHMKTDRIAFSVLITNFEYVRLTSKDIEVLKYCTDLQALDLGHQAIEDISVIADYLPELRILILSDNKIKDITPLKKLKKLHFLELFMNKITDLTPLSELDGLVDLNISYNRQLKDITPILNLPKLERLWLVSCKISKEDYALLRDTYPNAIVSSEGVGSTDRGWRTHPRYFAYIDMFKKDYMSELFTMYD